MTTLRNAKNALEDSGMMEYFMRAPKHAEAFCHECGWIQRTPTYGGAELLMELHEHETGHERMEVEEILGMPSKWYTKDN